MNFDLSPLWISLKTTLTATTITFFIGISAAWWVFNYRGKNRNLIDSLLTLPLVLPPTVIGFILLLLLGKNGLGRLLQHFGITLIFTWYATAIAATVVAFPLMYKTALGTFKQIDANLLAAARTLGASELRVFWQIALPLSKSGIIAGTILTFARALGEFGATLMLAGNIPGETQTIPTAIFFAAEGGEIDRAVIWVLVIIAISLVATLALNAQEDSNQKKQAPKRYLLPSERELNAVNKSSASLTVDIHKHLPNWTLTADFSADSYPLGILGASGAGKSILLRCIAGLETPNAGCITLGDRILFDAKTHINLPSCDRRIGFVFQNYALFPHLTVWENITFGIQNLPKTTRNQQASQLIALMHLEGLQNRYPDNLSGGEQQRVALARALAVQPQVLLLDEPFSALDTHLRSQLEKQLISILSQYQGVTLFVTHNLEEAYRACKNLLVLSSGKIVANGSKERIFERPGTYFVAQLTGCKNFSVARAIAPQKIQALDWGCTLDVIEPIPNQLQYVGIRAHQLIFSAKSDRPNTFPCWVVQTSETPHRMTIYLKLHQPPHHQDDYHLQAEVFKEKWANLKDKPLPWHIYLDPGRLFLTTE
ncbi:molybdate ABC transporter permease subunit [Aliterella atlantica]|uniref:Maltoporin n=1 Tax=Aliterella atlantica CENA595 TaxID=1618023 RepID=A0A0D8ZXU9_9CYAN|nr:molybdate ABC transporter permease subunit [Aliterella atlantica]KJH72046.1 maltoporin [Aliterella atlantica CENA595]